VPCSPTFEPPRPVRSVRRDGTVTTTCHNENMDDFPASPDPTATLLIRLWMSTDEPCLRARLIEISTGTPIAVATAAGENGIQRAVARWLEQRRAGRTVSDGSFIGMGVHPERRRGPGGAPPGPQRPNR
jgi:hypothetical protein